MAGEGSEDYGDYVTRCICDFKHDDGYMIACDGCRYGGMRRRIGGD